MDIRGRAHSAVLLVDVINPFKFEGAKEWLEVAETAAINISILVHEARSTRIPIVYVNDNFGIWDSDFKKVYIGCARKNSPGWYIARKLKPRRGDYFVLKPRHSGFFATCLDVMLQEFGTRKLAICGFATDMCILATAQDAHMRNLKLKIPSNCVAGPPENGPLALNIMRDSLGADIRPFHTGK